MTDADENYGQDSEVARGGLHREHVAALIRLGTVEQERGQSAEAERLLTEAIAVAEKHLGADDPSLGVSLSQLSRLHLRRSDYTGAEPLLVRLLQIARRKGDSHPDVATALAGLAAAKHGLGNDAAAEVMYRHALRIREAVLAPNHMAIVVTLEQLSEACAARGNVTEALELLRRALAKRESTLGATHASVLSLRTRVADLERRASGAIAPAVARPLSPMPAPAARVSPPAARAAMPASPVATPLPRAASPAPAPHVAPSTPRATPLPTPSWLAAVPASPSADVSSAATDDDPFETSELAPLPWTTTSDAGGVPIESAMDRPRSRRRAPRYATVGAALVVLAIAGFGFGSRMTNGSDAGDVTSEDAAGDLVSATSPAKPERRDAPPVVVPETRYDSAPVTTVSAPRVEAIADVSRPAPAREASSESAPSLPKLGAVSVPKVVLSNLDSVMATTARTARDREPKFVAAGVALDAPVIGDAGTITPPELIGPAPTPRFPDELRAHPIEGEVIVQFRVTEKGRVDVSSMQVLQSPHALFTEAVRSVLPKFRFEPAHSGGLDPKPQTAWVQFRTRFTAKN